MHVRAYVHVCACVGVCACVRTCMCVRVYGRVCVPLCSLSNYTLPLNGRLQSQSQSGSYLQYLHCVMVFC